MLGNLLRLNIRKIKISTVSYDMRSEMKLRGKSVHSWCDGSSDRSFKVDPLSISRSSQCSTTGVTKTVLSCMLDGAYKRTLAVNRKE